MSNSFDRPPIAGLAVSLVSAGDRAGALRVAALLCGCPIDEAPSELDVGGDDDATFAVELAERLASDSHDGVAGNTAVVLEPSMDVVEVALVLEHVLAARRPGVPVGIRDVVAVASVEEICTVLFGRANSRASVAGPQDYSSPGRLAARLEFASLIVLSDAIGAAAPTDTRLVQAFLARLAPSARVVDMDGVANVRPASGLLVRGRAHRLGATMGWQRELADGALRHASSEPCATVVFRDPRPFHPERLHDAVTRRLTADTIGCIARSRGFVRLASRVERVGSWSTAGEVLEMGPTAMMSWDVDSPIGQEIVFFGPGLDGEALADVLTSCVLTGEELAAGPEVWAQYADPFPEWVVEHHH